MRRKFAIGQEKIFEALSRRTLRDGTFWGAVSQALRARLRSHRPSGTFRKPSSVPEGQPEPSLARRAWDTAIPKNRPLGTDDRAQLASHSTTTCRTSLSASAAWDVEAVNTWTS